MSSYLKFFLQASSPLEKAMWLRYLLKRTIFNIVEGRKSSIFLNTFALNIY